MKKRIALVVNRLAGGGAERTAANLSRYLADRYDIDIIVNDDAEPQYAYRGQLITLHMRRDRDRMAAAYQIVAFFRRLRVLGKLKRTRDYAAVLSFSEMTNLANVLTAGKAIISVHNSVKNSRTGGWKYRAVTSLFFPFMFRRAYRTVACSKEISDELVSDYGLPVNRSCTIYNGIDLGEIGKRLSAGTAERPRGDGEKLIVSVGRLTRQKGQWHLIRAIGKLRDDGMAVRLVILGEGELRPALERLIAEAGLQDRCILPGFVDDPYDCMAKADAVVFPSLYEGFSNAIVEALACGAPVISTDHETGAREILAPDTEYRRKVSDSIDEARYGILIPVCDGEFRHADEPLAPEEQLMAEAIRRLTSSPERSEYYRKAAAERAGQLEMPAIAGRWSRLIETGTAEDARSCTDGKSL